MGATVNFICRLYSNTLEKANVYAKHSLPSKPATLVDTYLEGKERLDKSLVISQRHSRFSKSAMPSIPGEFQCSCKGECATKNCKCKENEVACHQQVIYLNNFINKVLLSM